MNIGQMAELKKIIGSTINEGVSANFPKVINFNRGIEFPKYKITIEEIQEDYFIDSKGFKWVKMKNDDEE